MSKKILVVGSLNIDLTAEVERIPKTGETLLANNLIVNCGGKGANQAYTCGKLGADVVMLGCVGNDSYGEQLIKNLNEANVDTSRICKTNTSTGMAFINVDKKGNNNIVVSSNANKECDIEYINKNIDIFDECEYVLLQLEIPISAINRVIEICKEKNIKIILNPAPIPENINELKYDGIDYIIPNQHELDSLVTEDKTVFERIDILNQKVKNVIVTLGENGVYYSNGITKFKKEAFSVYAVDTVAAGDCFTSAFVCALAKGKDIEESLIFASGASAISVTRHGAQSSIPTLKEVEEFLKGRHV